MSGGGQWLIAPGRRKAHFRRINGAHDPELAAAERWNAARHAGVIPLCESCKQRVRRELDPDDEGGGT